MKSTKMQTSFKRVVTVLCAYDEVNQNANIVPTSGDSAAGDLRLLFHVYALSWDTSTINRIRVCSVPRNLKVEDCSCDAINGCDYIA